MKVSKNQRGDAYIVEGAPAVRDIQKGSVWHFRMGSEDRLTLLDTSEKQAMAFPTDEAYTDFKNARSKTFAWDHEALGLPEPRQNPVARAAWMFKELQSLSDQQFQDMGWPAMEPQKSGGVKAAAARAAAKADEPKATKAKTADRGDER